MKKPKQPPRIEDLLVQATAANRLTTIIEQVYSIGNDRYLHWDKLHFYEPPSGWSHEEWWLALKLRRNAVRQSTPLRDQRGGVFHYCPTARLQELLHLADRHAGGMIAAPAPIVDRETKDRYLIRSLVDEAITSSQLEGAATTRLVARELIRSGRRPRDRGERMILNNFHAMQRISRLKMEPLTTQRVFELHRLLTLDTLDDPSAAGRFRRADERVVVSDMQGEVFHEPPPADSLDRRMADLCDFANGRTPESFVHPLVRAMILHFWLAYDHPFVDGNGRTARALFYWSALREGYWLLEFVSISEIILKGPTKYYRAFLQTETDDNDLTYFLLYHLRVIRRAMRALREFLDREGQRLRALEAELRGVQALNHRQRALISHALKHAHHRYAIESHRVDHQVVYETARSDLLDLADRGLLDKQKISRAWRFTPVHDLVDRLRTIQP